MVTNDEGLMKHGNKQELLTGPEEGVEGEGQRARPVAQMHNPTLHLYFS